MEHPLTSDNMQLNDVPPPGFTAPGKSLINEVEKLKEAVLLLCELQRELTKKVDAALNEGSPNEGSPITCVQDQPPLWKTGDDTLRKVHSI
jgi:hypothetical protein